jgi:hypothetical protein
MLQPTLNLSLFLIMADISIPLSAYITNERDISMQLLISGGKSTSTIWFLSRNAQSRGWAPRE